jgi:hypothetical protein
VIQWLMLSSVITLEWWSLGNPTTDDPDTSPSPVQSLSARPPLSQSSKLAACPCDFLPGAVGILLPLWLAFESICITLGITKRGGKQPGAESSRVMHDALMIDSYVYMCIARVGRYPTV